MLTDPRALLRQLAEVLADVIEQGTDAPLWYHQGNCPIHKTAYLRLVRAGKLQGSRVGARVLVKRAELDAYIEAHPVECHVAPEQDEDAMAAELLRNLGVKKAS